MTRFPRVVVTLPLAPTPGTGKRLGTRLQPCRSAAPPAVVSRLRHGQVTRVTTALAFLGTLRLGVTAGQLGTLSPRRQGRAAAEADQAALDARRRVGPAAVGWAPRAAQDVLQKAVDGSLFWLCEQDVFLSAEMLAVGSGCGRGGAASAGFSSGLLLWPLGPGRVPGELLLGLVSSPSNSAFVF